jgi:hypothetical protein
MRWNGTALAVQTDGWLDDEAKTAALLGEELYPPTAIAVLSPIAGSTESLEWLRIPLHALERERLAAVSVLRSRYDHTGDDGSDLDRFPLGACCHAWIAL